MPKFTLNNKELSFQKGEDILQVALREKNFIPHYCAHESLSRVATCRMCLVEVDLATARLYLNYKQPVLLP